MEQPQNFEEELRTNEYLQDEVVSISKTIAPWIPYIGLTLLGVSVAKYAYSRYVWNKSNHGNKADERIVPENKSGGSPGPEADNPVWTVPNDNWREE